VPGLTNGQSYTFTVTAANVAGTGTASAPSQVLLLGSVPSVPRTLSVTPAQAQLTVSWTVPASSVGSPVSGYTAKVSSGKVTSTCQTTTRLCVFKNLATQVPLTVTVTATNAVGTGPAALLPYAVFAVSAAKLSILVIPAVVQTKTVFTVLAYGATSGKTVTLGTPGSTATCTVDGAGQCWTHATIAKTGTWHAVASLGTTTAQSTFYAPAVKVPLQVLHGKALNVAISSAKPGCTISVAVGAKAVSTTASATGSATVSVVMKTLGSVVVTVTINGTVFKPYAVVVY
jgi:hypothetical protein